MIWFAIFNNLKDSKGLPFKLENFLVYFSAKVFSSKNCRDKLILKRMMKNSATNEVNDEDFDISIKKSDEKQNILSNKDYHLMLLVILNRTVLFAFCLFLFMFNILIFVFLPLFQ